MIRLHIDEDLLRQAQRIFSLYGQCMEESVLRFVERVTEYPLLPYEIGIGELDDAAFIEIRCILEADQ